MNGNYCYSKKRHSATRLGIIVLLVLLSTFLGPSVQIANAQVTGRFTLQVNTVALNCNVLNMWVTIQSSGGAVVQSGFAPLTFLGNAGSTYIVTVSDFQDKLFEQWEDHSTNRSRTIMLAGDTVVVAYYETSAVVQHKLTVNAVSLANGAPLNMWTTIQSNAGAVQTGFTPISVFTTSSSTSFVVSVSDYQNLLFDHWENGSTARTRSIAVNTDTTITAYFRTVSSFALTVNSALVSGSSLTGIYTTIASGSTIVATGFTPVRYSANIGGTYSVTPQDYGSYVFDHWDNGSTSRGRNITPTAPMALTAYYGTVLPAGGDTVAPSVTILAPAPGAVMSNSSPTIFGSASDNVGVTKVEVSVDGKAFSAATGLTEWSFGTAGLSNGSHSATVRVSDISGNIRTATVSFSVNAHPILHKTGVYVPLFVYPAGKEMIHYYDVICAKQAHPSVPIVTAINPASGPGSSIDTNYVNAAKKLKEAGVTVVGYVPTQYGSRDANAVLADISKYISWYGVDGIFLDEFASYTTGYENYYRQITAQAKSQGMKIVMGNAGTDVPESYVGTVDTIGITEEDGYNPIQWLQYCIGCTNTGWHYKHDKTNYWFVRYAIGTLEPTYVSEAAKWTGLIYMTNGVSPTRWDGIPPYFQTLVAKLDGL